MEGHDFSRVKVLDCSIRDGGHLNKWRFDADFVKKYYQAADKLGIDIIEIGYRTTPGLMADCGMWRFTTDAMIHEVLGGVRSQTKIAVMIDVGKIHSHDLKPASETFIDVIRIAFYKNQLEEALQLARELTDKGYVTTFNLMGITQYTQEELTRAISAVRESPAELVYIADSFGSLYPEETADLIKVLKLTTGKQVGFHPHNNLQLAFANTISAIKAGADYVDATVEGMGRGAGNLCLETLLLFLNKHTPNKYNVVPLLSFIERDLKMIKHDITWGYNTPYLLSGMHACHPNYAKTLIDMGHDIKDVSTILEKLKNQNTIGFKKDVLDTMIDEAKNGN